MIRNVRTKTMNGPFADSLRLDSYSMFAMVLQCRGSKVYLVVLLIG